MTAKIVQSIRQKINSAKSSFQLKRQAKAQRRSAELKEDLRDSKSPKIQENQTSYGVRFPWEAFLFMGIGLLSEVVDAMFMNATLETLGANLDPRTAVIISYIVGGGCFFSMAFVGFQLGNRRYYTKFGEYISYAFWGLAGIALVGAKLLAGLVDGGLATILANGESLSKLFATEEFISNCTIAIVQAVLYVGTGFMTRDSVKILTDNDRREYLSARRKLNKLLDELANNRSALIEDISLLQAYPEYAKRLLRSRQNIKQNIQLYNDSVRALIEARMAISVDPDIMEDMYNSVMEKEHNIKKEEK